MLADGSRIGQIAGDPVPLDNVVKDHRVFKAIPDHKGIQKELPLEFSRFLGIPAAALNGFPIDELHGRLFRRQPADDIYQRIPGQNDNIMELLCPKAFRGHLQIVAGDDGPGIPRFCNVLEIRHIGIFGDSHVFQESILRTGCPQNFRLTLIQTFRLDIETADFKSGVTAVKTDDATVVTDHFGCLPGQFGKLPAQRRRLARCRETGDGCNHLLQFRPFGMLIVDPQEIPPGPGMEKDACLVDRLDPPVFKLKNAFFAFTEIDRVSTDLDLFAPPVTHEETDGNVLVQQLFRFVGFKMFIREVDNRIGRVFHHPGLRPVKEQFQSIGNLGILFRNDETGRDTVQTIADNGIQGNDAFPA